MSRDITVITLTVDRQRLEAFELAIDLLQQIVAQAGGLSEEQLEARTIKPEDWDAHTVGLSPEQVAEATAGLRAEWEARKKEPGWGQ